jgi:hypothetical protein
MWLLEASRVRRLKRGHPVYSAKFKRINQRSADGRVGDRRILLPKALKCDDCFHEFCRGEKAFTCYLVEEGGEEEEGWET